MIALRVEDGYGGSVSLVVLPHERAAIPVVEASTVNAPMDVYLDAADLRDLARIATIAADELDRATAVTS
jgi:hypothetical protein